MNEQQPNSNRWIAASSVIGIVAGIVWLGAPIIPAVLGGVGAGLLIYYRGKR